MEFVRREVEGRGKVDKFWRRNKFYYFIELILYGVHKMVVSGTNNNKYS